MKYILVSTNDLCKPDNVHGRIQVKQFDKYEETYEQMKTEVLPHIEAKFVDAVLQGIEFTDMHLDKYTARVHRDAGQLNYYWKIAVIE